MNGKLDWALQRTVKLFQKPLCSRGDDVYADDFEDGKSMEERLMRKAVGSYFNLVITEMKAKGKLSQLWHWRRRITALVNPEGVSDDGLPF